VRRDHGSAGAGRDVTCAPSIARSPNGSLIMKNFVAPLSFTIAAAWVVVLFVLVHGTP
jgi:hypothetical protein